MPDFIKGFGHVQKNSSYFKTIFIAKSFMNFVGKRKELITSGITWLESRLMFTNEIVFDKEVIYIFEHDAFKDFIEDWEKGYRSVIAYCLLIFLFMDRSDVSQLPLGRIDAGIKNVLKDYQER